MTLKGHYIVHQTLVSKHTASPWKVGHSEERVRYGRRKGLPTCCQEWAVDAEGSTLRLLSAQARKVWAEVDSTRALREKHCYCFLRQNEPER